MLERRREEKSERRPEEEVTLQLLVSSQSRDIGHFCYTKSLKNQQICPAIWKRNPLKSSPKKEKNWSRAMLRNQGWVSVFENNEMGLCSLSNHIILTILSLRLSPPFSDSLLSVQIPTSSKKSITV